MLYFCLMKTVSLVFPHQLFREHPAIRVGVTVYLVEEWLFFHQYRFHRQKLVFHRASMKFYEHWLRERGFEVVYVSAQSADCDCRVLIGTLAAEGVSEVLLADTTDDWLGRRLAYACRRHLVAMRVLESPLFLTSRKNAAEFFDRQKRYFQSDFYIWQRKRWRLLLDDTGQPVGGKWSFDHENRKRFPAQKKPVPLAFRPDNPWLGPARAYVTEVFPDAIGSDDSNLLFGVTYAEAESWLDEFLSKRFAEFGAYEDAMVSTESLLYHSGLTPMLNVGLISPATVLKKALDPGIGKGVPLNAIEGFVRQLIGWREFIRIVYEREGRKQRTGNFWNFHRKIPGVFWTGETGIAPVDIVIRKLLKHGYCHHIERLMVIGNFMLLCEFDPDEVYRWFMEFFVDAYDWVMVPNIYGMSQFSDGGLIITKPYISGSHYLMKMGDFPKGEWQEMWDALFWRFLHVHRDYFKGNQRLGMLITSLDKMEAEKRDRHLKQAEDYLRSLDRS
jgi:deoxyribodipyrimidine photolyase-related protein